MASKPKPIASIKESDSLTIVYLPIDQVALWDKNPKRHDVDGLKASILRHGFRDAPIFDATLNALAAGNGRTRVARMLRDEGNPAPRGVRLDEHGGWLVPVQCGVDAATLTYQTEDLQGFPAFEGTYKAIQDRIIFLTKTPFRNAKNEDVAESLYESFRDWTDPEIARWGGKYRLAGIALAVRGVPDAIGHADGFTIYAVEDDT